MEPVDRFPPQAEVERLRARIAELEQRSRHEVAQFVAALLQVLPATVLRFDADLRITFARGLVPGVEEAAVLGAPALSFVPDEDRERVREVVDRTLATGTPASYQVLGPGPNGTLHRYDVLVAAIEGPEGKAGGCFVAHDVTKMSEQARALAESEERLSFALEATGLGLWTWDLPSGEVLWDDQMRRLLGRSTPLALDRYTAEVVHPDDREAVRANGERTFSTGVLTPSTHRIVRPDGQVRWVLNLGELMTDERGRPLRVMGGCSTSPSSAWSRRACGTRRSWGASAASRPASPTTSTTC
jgi:PAS domain S-box-containing protein